MEPFDVDKLIEFLVVTDQVDETFGLKNEKDDSKDERDDDSYQRRIGRWEDK